MADSKRDAEIARSIDGTIQKADRVAHNPLPLDHLKQGLINDVYRATFAKGGPPAVGYNSLFNSWLARFTKETKELVAKQGKLPPLKHDEMNNLVAHVQALSIETAGARDFDKATMAAVKTAVDDMNQQLQSLPPQQQQADPVAAGVLQDALAKVQAETTQLAADVQQTILGAQPAAAAAGTGAGDFKASVAGTSGELFGTDLESMPIPVHVRAAIDAGLGGAERSSRLAAAATASSQSAGLWRSGPIADPELEILEDTLKLLRSERRSPLLLSELVSRMHDDGVALDEQLRVVWDSCCGRALRDYDPEFGREVLRVDLLPALEFYALHRHLRSIQLQKMRYNMPLLSAGVSDDVRGLQSADAMEFYAHLMLVVVATACLVAGWPLREGLAAEQLSLDLKTDRESRALSRHKKACMLLVCLKTEPYAHGVMETFLTGSDVDVVVALAHRPLHWLARRAPSLLGRHLSGAIDKVTPGPMRAFVDCMLSCETLCWALHTSKFTALQQWKALAILYVHFTANLHADQSAIDALAKRQQELEPEISQL